MTDRTPQIGSFCKIFSPRPARLYYRRITNGQQESSSVAMRLIVVRAIPFTPTEQRRRQRRPDSFDMSKQSTEHRSRAAYGR